jgi:formylglycine-generating enzyme required for sulfatase activity
MVRRAWGTIPALMLALAGFGMPATAANQQAIELDCGSGVKMKLTLIPAGEFMMGGEEPPEEIARKCVGGPRQQGNLGNLPEGFQNEQPRQLVKINTPFYMGIYCVTQEQYHAVMGAQAVSFEGPTRPMEMVSWYGAMRFCRTLSEKTGMNVRLPTEAEWEYACRAGTTTAFNTGETISTDEANYNGAGAYGSGKLGENRRMTTPVGSFPPNAWGLYDMHGNVWQWCSSLYWAYPYNPQDGREDEMTSGDRAIRGGSWCHAPYCARSAKRIGNRPTDQLHDIGFRVVLTLGVDSPAKNEQRESPAQTVVSQAAIGEHASGPCALLNALKFGGNAERAATAKIPGEDDLARVRTLIATYGSKASLIFPDRKRFEADRGCDDHELLEIALDASRSLGLKPVSGTWFDRAKDESSADLVRRIHGLLRRSLEDGFPPIVLMGSYTPASERSNPDAWSWSRAGEHWASVVSLPEKLEPGALGFAFRFADSSSGKVREGYFYALPRSFSGRKGDDRVGHWMANRPFLMAVTPSLSLDLQKTPWFLRTEIALEYGIIRAPANPAGGASLARAAQREPGAPAVVKQQGESCAICSLFNALRFGGAAERAAAAKIPGADDPPRTALNAEIEKKLSEENPSGHDRWLAGAHILCRLLNLKTVSGTDLDRANDESSADHVRRIYTWLRRSLDDGFPPVVNIWGYSALDEPSNPDGRCWKKTFDHCICVIGLPEKLEPEALGFVFRFADSADAKVHEGCFYVEQYRNFGSLKIRSGRPLLQFVMPREGEQKLTERWFQRTTVHLIYAVFREPAAPAGAP